jgi:RNA polymerase sigma-54 factor
MKALDQRATNLLKVATEIIRQQEMFLQRGVHFLKPMRLTDIATATGLHESTVSRITTRKYIATPRGAFELKYFFTSGIGGCDGDQEILSSRAVMHTIKQMIAKETAKTVLSDDAIAKKLNERGINVARRTVVKYRSAMGIPSSIERRRVLKAKL